MNLKRKAGLIFSVGVATLLAITPTLSSTAFELTGQGATPNWVPSSGWSGQWEGLINTGRTLTNTLPSGVSVTVSSTGTVEIAGPWNGSQGRLSWHGGTPSNYGPGVTTDTPAITVDNYCKSPSSTAPNFDIYNQSGGWCTNNTLSRNRGTVVFTFSQPVTNPVFHFSGIGGYNSRWIIGGSNNVIASNIMKLWTEINLTSPANGTMTELTSNVNEFEVDSTGKKYRPTGTGSTVSSYCTTTDDANDPTNTSGNSGCGSIRVNGTSNSFVFTLDYNSVGGVTTPVVNSTSDDAFMMSVSIQDDYGSGPSSYDTATTYHAVGDLFMGAGVTPDALDARTPASDATGDDEANSSFKALPSGAPSPGTIGSNYTVTVPVTASAAGKICGWVDWNGNGTYDTAERQCSTFASGASSQTLTWVVPAGAAANSSWMRLRASYDTTGVESPVGALNSGEVEDFAVAAIAAPAAVNDVSSGPMNQPQDQTVLGNDSSSTGTAIASSTLKLLDPSNNTYGTSPVTIANQGTYSISGNKIVFTPVSGYSGTATPVTYQVADSLARTATATYTPTIIPAPNTGNDTSTGLLNTPQDQVVLSNDSSSNGIALSASTIKLFDPSNSTYGTSPVTITNQGTYSISGNKIVFTPVTDYVGTATPVTYQVADSLGQTATATYTPTILTAAQWASHQARAASSLPYTGTSGPSGTILAALMMAMAGAAIYFASLATAGPRRRTRN